MVGRQFNHQTQLHLWDHLTVTPRVRESNQDKNGPYLSLPGVFGGVESPRSDTGGTERSGKGIRGMLRLNRQTDYGIMILTCLVREGEGEHPRRLLSAPEIAMTSGLALPNVSKILKALVRGKILESRRGVQGGYQLSRPSAEISIQQVITALDGPIAMTDCAEGGPDQCDVGSLCPMSENWKFINDRIVETLENITLEQMAIPGGVLAAAGKISESEQGRMKDKNV